MPAPQPSPNAFTMKDREIWPVTAGILEKMTDRSGDDPTGDFD